MLWKKRPSGSKAPTARFSCHVCGAAAGEVTFLPAGVAGVQGDGPPGVDQMFSDRARVVYRSFTGIVEALISDGSSAQLARAVQAADPGAIREVYSDAVPYYCSSCDKSYCYAHWTLDVVLDDMPGQIDYITGTCPAHHRGTVEDRPMGFPSP